MQITTAFKHMDATEAIKTYAREKSDKLNSYFNGRIAVDWIFSVEKQNHIARCHLVGNHMDYYAEVSTEDGMYAAIDFCIDKIERQIRKHKEIVKDHLHRGERRIAS